MQSDEEEEVEETVGPQMGRPRENYELLWKKEKNRTRQAAKRARDREEKAAQLNQGSLKLLRYNGIGATCARLEQYSPVMLPWVVAVGLAPSAAGARAPIYGIVSAVSHNVKPNSVELFRGRMRRFLRIKSAAFAHQELPECSGIGTRRDETQMKLCMEGTLMRKVRVDVRCLALFEENGDTVEALPLLCQLGNKKAV